MKKEKSQIKISFYFLVVVFIFPFLFFPFLTQAQENVMENFIANMPFVVNQPLVELVFNVIRYLLGFLGVVAVVILIYGGFLWMTARGNEEQVKKAKKTIINGLIGLIIIILSFVIVSFVFRVIQEAAQPPEPCRPGEIRGCYTCDFNGQWFWDYSRCPAPPGEKFLITKIVPKDGPNIRNSVIRIYFNKIVKPDTLDQEDVLVEKTHYSEDRGLTWIEINPPLPIAGTLILESDRVVKFTPETNCPPPNDNRKCFNEWSKFKVEVKEGKIESDESPPKSLSCANNKCFQDFWTNDIVDTLLPNVMIYEIEPSQGNMRYIPNNTIVLIRAKATDDSGISQVEFYFNNVLKAIVENPDQPPPENIYSFTLNTAGLIPGSSHTIKAKAYDLDENTAEVNHQVIIRAFHCFNGIQDEDEEGVDCGGANCGACQGGACDNPRGGECNPDNNLCGSNLYCHPTSCTCQPRGGPGIDCKIEGICSPLACPPPGNNYSQCVASDFEPPECRCCCQNDLGCQAGLTCDITQTCWQSGEIEIKGLCCGCQNSNQCSANEICKSVGGGPNCCYACGVNDDRKPCNGGECCTVNGQPICCRGRCVNNQCLTLCGNGKIDDPREQCDGNDLGGKTCRDLNFVDGTVACNPDCTFDTTGCIRAGDLGRWGDVCQNPEIPYCTTGAANCSLAQGAACVKNEPGAPCACCCQPDNSETEPNEDTCQDIDLVCDITKNCSRTDPPQKGLCCGCGTDDNKCCKDPPCIGVACKENCCIPFPAPTNLQMIDPTVDKIKLTWEYSDPENLATHFEIWRKAPNQDSFSCFAGCEIEDFNNNGTRQECFNLRQVDRVCEFSDENPKFSLTRSAETYTFIDSTGGFSRLPYSFKVRARKGTRTAYSEFTDEASATPRGVVGPCTSNAGVPSDNPCPIDIPCCLTAGPNQGQCVTVDLCNPATRYCAYGGFCQPPEAKFDLADFLVQPPPAIAGPCLLDVSPRQGYVMETLIDLTGLEFGTKGMQDNVLFNDTKADYTNLDPPFSWSDTEIKNTRINIGTSSGSGEVKVRKGKNDSNALEFKVLTRGGNPGDQCRREDISACQIGFDQCHQPEIYHCLFNQDCRCCCDPNNNQCQHPLVCTRNVGPCTGDNRGLCCGCTSDAQCGTNLGCGFLDPNRCCYARPTVTAVSSCLVDNQVGLNTAITIRFSQLMHHPSLNPSTIQIYRPFFKTCEENEEKKDDYCHLKGQIVNEDYTDDLERKYTQSTFYPQGCKLRPNTTYYVKIIGGANGVLSNKGVRMADDYPSQFTTGVDIFCGVEKVGVSPKGVTLRTTDARQIFTGEALDSRNNRVCVTGFYWTSETISPQGTPPNEIATLDPLFGLQTTATAQTKSGRLKIKATSQDKSGEATLNVFLGGPQVIEDSSCRDNTQSPSPWRDSTDVCINALISARFDQKMKLSSINTNSILVHSCASYEPPDRCEGPTQINGTIREAISQRFKFKPNNFFNPNTWYRLTLRGTNCSGYNCLMNTGGVILDGNRDGEPGGDYFWFFKTRDSTELCPLASVSVSCEARKIIHPGGSTNCIATPQTAGCNILDPEEYSWDWESDDPSIAEIKPLSSPGNNTATATSKSLGETDIKATAGEKTGHFHLIVATKPRVEENYPANDAINVCRNTAIWAEFDQKMDEQSFINNFKVERQPDLPEVGNGDEDITDKFSLRFETIDSKTKVYFVPEEPLLKEDKYYVITIKKEKGVKSIAPFSEEMANDHSWKFTTGLEICLLDKVVVDADPARPGIQNKWLFRKSLETQNFEAIPLAKDGQRIQKVPGSYEWIWSWTTSEPLIAQVISADEPIRPVTAQPKNGLTTITATATITRSNIPQSPVETKKSGSALAEVFLCENIWPCKRADWPNCKPYQDLMTNFEFRYCRDAGSPRIEGDLPILKGGPITGASEPDKLREHLFSVYDGSLSLYYDGEGEGVVREGEGVVREGVVNNLSGYNNPNYDLYPNNPSSFGTITSGFYGHPFDGKSLSFGIDAYLNVDHNITLEPQILTLASWVKGGEGERYLFKKGSTGSTGQGYNLKIRSDNKIYFWLYDKEGQKKEIVSSDPINPNNWTHLTATYDGRSLKIYINGILKGETLATGIKYEGATALKIGGNNLVLDEIALYSRALDKDEIEALTKKPIEVSLADVIGFKVFSNFDHLRPSEWYERYAPGAVGSPATKIIDGYQAVQVGRTIYVGATNVPNPNNIYSNIYLVSHNDLAKSETLNIFNQISANWRFNINNISSEDKGKLARDLERIYHLNDLVPLFENYKREKGEYPKVEAGSFIVGITTSKWPSWNKPEPYYNLLGRLGAPLIVDPINKFANHPTLCGTSPNQYTCCANCPRGDPQCDETCFNPPPINKYECNPGSHIYQYRAEGRPIGSTYGFFVKFEYAEPDKWQHNCQRFNDEKGCKTSHWCEWKECPSLRCYPKLLNHDLQINPCPSPSSCKCFNSKYKPSIHGPSLGQQCPRVEM